MKTNKKKKAVDYIEGEKWKPIGKYDGRFEISNFGRLKNSKSSYHGERLLRLQSQKQHSSRKHTKAQAVCMFLTYATGTKTRKNINIGREVARAFDPSFDERLTVDHIDGNKMDNHIDNLRTVTIKENNLGFKTKMQGATSKYRGVSKHRNKWVAYIVDDEKRKYLGTYDCEKEAAIKRDEAATAAGYPNQSLNFSND